VRPRSPPLADPIDHRRLRRAFSAPLARRFYERPAAAVARELVGTILVRRTAGRLRAVRLVETEAYGRGDPASHSFRGETARNRSMFGPPGHLYVYPIHQVVCANAVARSGEAVLLRAAEPLHGVSESPSGPGRLCRALGITRAFDGADLLTSDVRIAAGTERPTSLTVGPRVGIQRAAERPLRFSWPEHPWVSRPRPNVPRGC